MTKLVPNPRFFGPVHNKEIRAQLVETLLDCDGLSETINQFVSGEIESKQMSYEIQCMLEGIVEQWKDAGECPEAIDDNWEGA